MSREVQEADNEVVAAATAAAATKKTMSLELPPGPDEIGRTNKKKASSSIATTEFLPFWPQRKTAEELAEIVKKLRYGALLADPSLPWCPIRIATSRVCMLTGYS
ncbi:unnamed protein product [Vitrella brassicaformis CCMP3155]|uniref:Uncharacterized protein n=1 Tax=Vitrella brassicaformis (strain CCMP3155) TaxID=1169540 RepID=A0A0G4EUN8_VITBC|nr:unnamed protein product [Vitrella brassicaformis CCMP3155]|eukprot:CEM02299.1 unnamed protein product [Vitrella brassicaformis CCMP3155]